MSNAFRPSQPNPRLTQPRGAIVALDRADLVTDPRTTLLGEPGLSEMLGRQTVAMPAQHVQRPSAPVIAGPPPEIQLMEHRLATAERNERAERRLAVYLAPDSERAAAFRVLRHHLLEAGRPQCVIVSSPHRGDGKTTAAVNLALALAECGRAKVLLVEAHLRRPQLASVFGFLPPRCFAAQLDDHRQQPTLPWTLVNVPDVWLHVAAVDPRLDRAQLLDGPAFAIAIERMRAAGYEHIVVDAPPVLGSADVNLMADAADAVVFALRAQKSTVRDVRKSIDQIGERKFVGSVLIED